MLDEQEFELINVIGAELGPNQRELSRLLDLSLGQTNILIKRLVTKGYIRISKLDKRRVKYLLTPQGLAEKMSQSVKYTLRTINSIGLIKERFKVLFKDMYAKGERRFFVLGESDLASLVEMAMRDLALKDCRVERIKELPTAETQGTILVCQEGAFDTVEVKNKVDLIHELAKDPALLKENNEV